MFRQCADSIWVVHILSGPPPIKCSEKPVLIENDCKIRCGKQAHCSSETMRFEAITVCLVALLLGLAQAGLEKVEVKLSQLPSSEVYGLNLSHICVISLISNQF